MAPMSMRRSWQNVQEQEVIKDAAGVLDDAQAVDASASEPLTHLCMILI